MLNLTQHVGTPDQMEDGLIEPSQEVKERVKALLTFEEMPVQSSVDAAVLALAQIALDSGAKRVMVGGAPWLMATLERALYAAGIQPYYSFTKRQSAEVPDGQGGVKKTQTFRHEAFFKAFGY
jgi:L-lysine 2,3-aminomutase